MLQLFLLFSQSVRPSSGVQFKNKLAETHLKIKKGIFNIDYLTEQGLRTDCVVKYCFSQNKKKQDQ